MLHAQAVTDKAMINNKALYDKIAKVNYIINNYDGSLPPFSFELRNSAEVIKANKQSGWCALGLAGIMLCQMFILTRFLRMTGFAMAVMAGICAIISFATASYLEKKVIAEVNGDSIIVNGRTYSYTEITEINRAALNNLKVMSGGRSIFGVNKSCDGCVDLIRWAKQHNIPINDTSDADAKTVEKKQTALVLFIVLICIAVATAMVLLKRM